MITKQYSKTKPVCKVTFSVPVVQAGAQADLRVLGDFNQWNWEQALQLTPGKEAYQGALELAAGQSYEFRYLADGQRWLNEEAADGYVATPYFSHNCLLQLEAPAVAPAATAKQPKAAPARAKQPAAKAAPAESAPARPAARLVETKPSAPAQPPVVNRLFSGFLLQAGVFSSAQRAEELHAKLTLSGVPSTLETRVQVGPFRTRQEAEAAQAKLKQLGVETILVPPKGKY